MECGIHSFHAGARLCLPRGEGLLRLGGEPQLHPLRGVVEGAVRSVCGAGPSGNGACGGGRARPVGRLAQRQPVSGSADSDSSSHAFADAGPSTRATNASSAAPGGLSSSSSEPRSAIGGDRAGDGVERGARLERAGRAPSRGGAADADASAGHGVDDLPGVQARPPPGRLRRGKLPGRAWRREVARAAGVEHAGGGPQLVRPRAVGATASRAA